MLIIVMDKLSKVKVTASKSNVKDSMLHNQPYAEKSSHIHFGQADINKS